MSGPTIYRSVAAERDILERYDELVRDWPLAVEESDLESRWGRIHVLSWGPADGRPLLLCHAASMAAPSWLPNAAALADETARREVPDIDHDRRRE